MICGECIVGIGVVFSIQCVGYALTLTVNTSTEIHIYTVNKSTELGVGGSDSKRN